MNIYKTAQALQILNPKDVQAVLIRIRNNNEFENYVSLLSQIHENTSQGMALEESIAKEVTGYPAILVKKIINGIGGHSFTNAPFDEISSQIISLRNEGLGVKPTTPKPVAPQSVSTETEEDDFDTEEVSPGNKIKELDELYKLEPAQILAYYKSFKYAEKYRDEPQKLIKNMENIYDQLLNDETLKSSEFELKKKWRELKSLMTTLNLMASEDWEVEESISVLKPVIDKAPDIDGKVDETEPLVGSAQTLSNVAVDVGSVIPLQHPIFSGLGVLLDTTQSPPVLNEDALSTIHARLAEYLNGLIQDVAGGKKVNPSSFNKLIYSVKSIDMEIYQALKAYRKSIVNNPELLTAADDLINKALELLPTQRFKDHPRDQNNLYMVTLGMSSKQTAAIVLGFDEKTKISQFKKVITAFGLDYQSMSPADLEQLSERMSVISKQMFDNKTKVFFNINYRIGINNYLNFFKFKSITVFKKSIADVLPQTPKYEMKPCPSCYKMVPWGYSRKLTELMPHLEGFTAKLFSFYRQNGDERGEKITEKELRSRDAFPAPNPKMFSSKYKREKDKIASYKGKKTWDQILADLASNNPELHEEGWHRRASVLQSLGGEFIADKLIKRLMVECPFTENSGCGAAFTPPPVDSPLGSVALQPTWNGLKLKPNQKYSTQSTLNDEVWTDKKLLNKVKRKVSGGFKFSKINFACPCHIPATDGLTEYKHNTMVISKTGPIGTNPLTVYPTRYDGSLDFDINKGTLAYLICGAPTSLSAFDRNIESTGFIVKHLAQIKTSSVDDYKLLLNFLIKSGVDVEDLIEIDSNLEFFADDMDKMSSGIKTRLTKIANLIKNSAINIREDSNLRRLFGGLTLICPFGHKFTVDQSLNFGDKYIGVQDKEIVTSFGNIINSKGLDNLTKLINEDKVLVRADNYPEHTALPYEEWIKYKNRTIQPIMKEPNRPVLLFTLSILKNEELLYVLRENLQARENAWDSDRSYESRNVSEDYVKGTSLGASFARPKLSFDGGTGDGALERETSAQWVGDTIAEMNEVDNRKVIPGSLKSDGSLQGDAKELNSKIASFSRALKSSLRIVVSWTTALASNAMVSSLLTDYNVDVTPYADVFVKAVIPHLSIVSGEDDKPVISAHKTLIEEEVKRYLVTKLNDRANEFYDWIRQNIYDVEGFEDFDQEVAMQMIASIIENFNDDFDSQLGLDYVVNIERDDLRAFSIAAAREIIKKAPDLVKEITFNSAAYNGVYKEQLQYTGRIAFVGYAHFVADALVAIYNKYCKNPESEHYIGYNIGIDLSSRSNIIGVEQDGKWIGGITKDGIEKIVSSLKEAGKVEARNGKLPETERLDQAWTELEMYLSKARHFAISGKAMESSKDFLISRLTYVSGKNKEHLRERINNVFPIRTLNFDGSLDKPETSRMSLPRYMIPFVSKEYSIQDYADSELVREYMVIDNLAKYVKELKETNLFDSQEQASEYIQIQEQKYPAGTLSEYNVPINFKRWDSLQVRPASYFRVPSINYDGSKVQIGTFGGKPATAIRWPPDPIMGYSGESSSSFAGLILPFDIADPKIKSTISRFQDILIPDYRIIIDIDGEPTDISFLFQRGRSPEELQEIAYIELQIQNIVDSMQTNIVSFKQKNAKQIAENSALLSSYESKVKQESSEMISGLLNRIAAKDLRVKTTSSYATPGDPYDGKQAPMLVLEDPVKAYKLITNPHLRGMELSSEQQDRLISFIVGVYNLEEVYNVAKHLGVPDDFTMHDLLTLREQDAKTITKKVRGPSQTFESMLKLKEWKDSSGKERPGWRQSLGSYYDLVPGTPESIGSYVQYVYQSDPSPTSAKENVKYHPTGMALTSAIHKMNNSGYSKQDAANSKKLAAKLEEEIRNYIVARTSGSRKNDAIDFKSASLLTNKNYLTESELDGIMVMLGVTNLDDIQWPDF